MEEATEKRAAKRQQQETAEVNPLRKEKVIVKFVPHKGGPWGDDPKHALYGGMAEDVTMDFVVPMNAATGAFVDVLGKEERGFIEEALGLEPNAMNPHTPKADNFWTNYSVKVAKRGTVLDLSDPEDYVRYKILLANGDVIAPNLREMEDRPKSTYRFVLVSADDETRSANSKMDATMESYREFGKVENDVDKLRVLVEILDSRPYAEGTKSDFLKARVNALIQEDAKAFLKAIKDPMLNTKVVLRRATELGKVIRRNDLFYLADGNVPMCEAGEDSTLSVAARWLNRPSHQDVKALLEAEVDKARTRR